MNSFKVICIENNWRPSPSAVNNPVPSVGDVDTVIGQVKYDGFIFYQLERFENDNLYRSDCFATLPEVFDEEIAAEEEGAELDQTLRDIILEAENT